MLGHMGTSCRAEQLRPGAVSPGTRAVAGTLPLIKEGEINWLVLPEVSAILLSHPSV